MSGLLGAAMAAAAALPIVGVLAVVPASAQPMSGRLASGPLELVAGAPRLPLGTRYLGQVGSRTTISGAVALVPRDESGLQSFIENVTNPHSSLFHQYLTKAQYVRDFAPTAATVAAVTSELRAVGVRVSGVSSNNLLVDFSASTATVEAAFHTGLADYRMPTGFVGQGTTSAVRLPGSIARDVTGVLGLDDLVREQPTGLRRPSKRAEKNFPKATSPHFTHPAGSPDACGAAVTDANGNGGLTDDAIANAYGAFGLYGAGDTAAGQTIAVFELESLDPSDLSTFDTCYFGSAAAAQMAARLHVIGVDGGQPAGFGSGESVLDVEDVSAVAPGANIDVYEAPNTSLGSIDQYNTIVSDDTANILTSSWGLCELALQQGDPGVQGEENDIFQEAAAQGMSVFASSGDAGSDDCNTFETTQPVAPVLSVDDPGSQPYVVSVGGTTIDNATEPPSEHVWNDGPQWGADGGGISQTWAEPSWQADSPVPGMNNATEISDGESVMGNDFCEPASGPLGDQPCREVPDVTAQADEFTGAVTIYSASFTSFAPNGWSTIGGTSSSAPLWAAMLALVNASSTCTAGSRTTHGVGFVSPLLYAVASVPADYAASFNDITEGNNDVYGVDDGATFAATTGFDMASGLGSPQLTGPGGTDGLAFFLCSLGNSPTRPAVTGLVPSAGSTTAPTTVAITGTGFRSAGSSDVTSVWVDDDDLSASSFTVTSDTSITATLPAGETVLPTGGQTDGAGPANVAVTLADGETSALGPASGFDYVDMKSGTPSPAVTAVSSYGGSEAGGNTVTVFGSGFTTTAVGSVTFGGVDATNVDVVSDHELTATAPAYSGLTDCVTMLDPTTDMCQVEIVVTNTAGVPSRRYRILKSYEGPIILDDNAAAPAPPGCRCEVTPAPSEYDYVPTPTITSVSTSDGPSSEASELDGGTITVGGTGFNDITLEGAFVGGSTETDLDQNFSFVSGTEVQLAAPGLPAPTTDSTQLSLAIESRAGTTAPSSAAQVTYSGLPQITSSSPGFAVDTGGTKLSLSGDGFDDVDEATVADLLSPFPNFATVFHVTVASDRSASFPSPQMQPSEDTVELCTTTSDSVAESEALPGCGLPSAAQLLVYPPGNPVLTSASVTTGPARGATDVTLTGQNLGCVTAVDFGTTAAETFSNAEALLDCGQTNTIDVVAPPGVAGSVVKVTVTTIESEATGSGPSTSSVEYAYTTSPPSQPVSTAGLGKPLVASSSGADASVSWKAPLSDGGSPVLGYVVLAESPGRTTVVDPVSAGTLKVTLTTLTAGVPWTFVVYARSAKGNGFGTRSNTVVPR
jgi:hypothetical protein